jgi:hypothetical protein
VATSWPNKTIDCSKTATEGHPPQQLLCHTQQLLRDKYGSALLYKPVAGGASSELVCGGLDGSCIMDPHPDLPYLEHVLDMARTSIAKTPSSGVCIDRQVSDTNHSSTRAACVVSQPRVPMAFLLAILSGLAPPL